MTMLTILGGMPACAYPQAYRKGRLSYTICSSATGAKVECLLKAKAFRILKVGERDGYWASKIIRVYQKPAPHSTV